MLLQMIFFKFSVSDCLLLVYRNTIDLGDIFILYPAILLNLLISSSSFFVDSVGFSTCTQSCLRIKMGLIPPSNLNAFYTFFLPDRVD